MFVTRLVSQLGIGPKLAEPQLPSDPPRRHSDIAEAKLSSLSTEPNEGADDGGIPEQSKTHSQSFIAPSLELGHSKRVEKALAFKKISSCGVLAAIPVQLVMS